MRVAEMCKEAFALLYSEGGLLYHKEHRRITVDDFKDIVIPEPNKYCTGAMCTHLRAMFSTKTKKKLSEKWEEDMFFGNLMLSFASEKTAGEGNLYSGLQIFVQRCK